MMDGSEVKTGMSTDQYIYYCGDIYIRGDFVEGGSSCRDSFIPVQVIYNGITTIAIFKDGTRVISRPQTGEKFDKETGLAMCIAKRVAGGRSAFLRLVEKANDQNKKAPEE
jgi:hypothetical protein